VIIIEFLILYDCSKEKALESLKFQGIWYTIGGSNPGHPD
jgi:hypothetical protein